MEKWQQLISHANQHFAMQDYATAEEGYREAIKCSQTLFQHWFDSAQSISAYLCSYHNLAHLLIKQRRPKDARVLLESLQSQLSLHLDIASNSQRHKAIAKAFSDNTMALNSNFFDTCHDANNNNSINPHHS